MKLDFWDYMACTNFANLMTTGIFVGSFSLFFIGAGSYFLYETLCIKVATNETNN